MDSTATFPYPRDDPDQLLAVAARSRRAASRSADAAEAMRRNVSGLTHAWQGPAATACRTELTAASRLARRLADPLNQAGRVVESFHEAVSRARAAIDRVRADFDDELARQRDALARPPAGLPPQVRRLLVEDLRWAHQQGLGSCHRRYAAILDELEAQCRVMRRELVAAAWSVLPRRGNVGSPATAEALLVGWLPLLEEQRRLTGGATGALPSPGTPAGLVRRWWGLLTSDEHQRLVDTVPASIGALDGLPASARSRANERFLDRLIADLSRPRSLDDQDRRSLDNARAVRRELDAARRGRDLGRLDTAAVQLLAFDPRAFGGEGRAVVAVGDVDVADHVAFIVPGLDANLRESMAELVGTAALLGREAQRTGSSTAAVAWMGYDAPGLTGVVGDGAARAGAELLARDVLALQASRDVVPHLTVIGHSYGSTTAGTALRAHLTGVDDAVLVGSPGPNVEHASDLHVPAGHVFVGASSRDPISYLDRFGLDPAHETFGAVRFRAEDVTRSSWRVDIDDHSKYFEPNSESLQNIVHIVVGSYGEVTVGAYREERPFLPDGINSDPEADREPTVPDR